MVFATQAAAAEAYLESQRQHRAAAAGTPEHQLTRLRSETALEDLATMAESERTDLTMAEAFRQYLDYKGRALRTPLDAPLITVTGLLEKQVNAMRSRGLTIFPSWAHASAAAKAASSETHSAPSALLRSLAEIKLQAYVLERDKLAGSLGTGN